jgi:hypothetical protein
MLFYGVFDALREVIEMFSVGLWGWFSLSVSCIYSQISPADVI